MDEIKGTPKERIQQLLDRQRAINDRSIEVDAGIFTAAQIGVNELTGVIKTSQDIYSPEGPGGNMVDIGNEILSLADGGSGNEKVEIYGYKNNFFIEDVQEDSLGEIIFAVENGMITKDDLREDQLSSLTNLLEEHRFIVDSEASVKSELKSSLGDLFNQDKSLSDRLEPKEFAVIQSIFDLYAQENPEAMAQMLTHEGFSQDEAIALFEGLGLDAYSYGREVDQEHEL